MTDEEDRLLTDALSLQEDSRIRKIYDEFHPGLELDSQPRSADSERSFYFSIEDRVRTIICKNEKVKALAGSLEKSHGINLALAVCDLLSVLFSGPCLYLISAQVAHRGLNLICKDDWKSASINER